MLYKTEDKFPKYSVEFEFVDSAAKVWDHFDARDRSKTSISKPPNSKEHSLHITSVNAQ